MPILLSIVGALIPFAASFVGRIILALGFGFVEFQGINTLITYVTTEVNTAMGGLGGYGEIAAWAGLFKIDVHVSILLSAVGVKVLLNSLGGGTVRRLVQKV